MKITEKKKREHLISIIRSYLKTNISIMEYYYVVANDRKSKKVCRDSITSCEEAIAHLQTIKHIEILDYLYGTFVGNNVIAYSISGKLVKSSKLAHWDTEEGFEEFKVEMEEKKKKAIAEAEEREKTKEAVKKAKAEGKKVEMVYDKETKKVRPVIVEEKPNA